MRFEGVKLRRVELALLAALSIVGCQKSSSSSPSPDHYTEISDWRSGEAAIEHYGCASCHTIPGIRGADALVGPPLDHMARRVYVAGVLTNTRRNLIQWIRNPPEVDSKTAMPNLHVTDADAQSIASYLYTLR